jgi:hypothetical protein
MDELASVVAQSWLKRQVARMDNLRWWQLHTAAEWQYQRPFWWEIYPSGTVVIYE